MNVETERGRTIGHGRVWRGLLALAALGLLVHPAAGAAQDAGPTFTEDVAPILQQSCQQCHQEGGMAPMALTTYEEVRPWTSVIKTKVETRMMPPWHVDKRVGIQAFKNDISLEEEEIRTIVEWVDGGAPQGDPARMPPPVEWPDWTAWELEEILGRPPDLIIRSDPYTINPNGLDQWWEPEGPIEGLTGTRWAMAAETKPTEAGRPATHHANSFKIPLGAENSSGAISRFVVGKRWEIFPEDTGMRFDPGDRVRWNIHYFPIGEPVVDDVLQVGVWFYPEGHEPEQQTVGESGFSSLRAGQTILIPPNGTQVTQGVHVLERPARIYSLRAHQHLLGKSMTFEAIYPDGRVEVLNRLGWDFRWHITYLYEDHAMPLLPRGTVLVITSEYDNTANNLNNPNPDRWVVYGRRTVDEMSHAQVGITYFDTDEAFERAVAEREETLRRLAVDQEDGDE